MDLRSALRIGASLLLVGCGASATPAPMIVAQAPPPAAPSAPSDEPAPEGPRALPFDVPEPLGLAPAPPPLPPLGGRASFPSPDLIDVWQRAVRVRPTTPAPAPPDDLELTHVQEWAERSFASWLERRRVALMQAEHALNAFPRGDLPPHELAVAGALSGRLYDETLYDMLASAAVPTEIADDDELLRVYLDAVWAAGRPLLEQARQRFAFCVETFTRADAEGWVSPWRTLCSTRLQVLDRASAAPPPDAVAIRRRLEAWAPRPALAVAAPALDPLRWGRASAPPRDVRADATALDGLVRGVLLGPSDAGALEAAWQPFTDRYVEGAARFDEEIDDLLVTMATEAREPSLVRYGAIGVLRAAPAEDPERAAEPPTEAPEPDPDAEARRRADTIAGFEHSLADLLDATTTLETRSARCWLARGAVLGLLAIDHGEVARDHAEAFVAEAREEAAFQERQRLRVALATDLGPVSGDALVQAALRLGDPGDELDPTAASAVRAALAAYVAAPDVDGPEATALRAAIAALATAPAPAFARPRASATLADRARHQRELFAAMMRSPSAGSRAVLAYVDALGEDEELLSTNRERWHTALDVCR